MAEPRTPLPQIVDVAQLSALDDLHVDGVALFAFAGRGPLGGVGDLIDWRLLGQVGQALAQGLFAGEAHEQLLVPAPARIGGPKVFVFGLGPQQRLTPEGLRQRLQQAVTTAAQAGSRRLALVLPSSPHDASGPCPLHDSAIEDLFAQAGAATNGHIIAKVLRHRVD